MSFLDTIGSLIKGAASRLGGRRLLASFLMQGSSIGQYNNSWTDSRYEQVRHYKHWVYVGIDRIASEVAMHFPNVSFLRDANNPQDVKSRQRWLCDGIRRKALTPLLSHEHLEPVPSLDPLLRLLQDPNEPDTAYDLWYETILYLYLTGSAYWWMPRNALGLPAAIWVLPSHWVWAVVGRERVIDSYEIRPVEGNYLRMSIPADDVIQFRKKSPISKVDGYSPLTAMAQWVDTQESIDKSRWFSFRNGATPGVMIAFDEKTKIPDDDFLNRIEAKFMARYSTEINTNKPLFVPPGCEIKPLSIPMSEMMYIESTEQMRDQILATLGVPATVAGVNSDMTYGSVAASQSQFYRGTINPLFRYFGQNITEKLAPRYPGKRRVWWEDRTPQDPDLFEKALQSDVAAGIRTLNEARALRGLEPYPHGGDDPLVQGAMMTLPFGTGGEIISINSDKPAVETPVDGE